MNPCGTNSIKLFPLFFATLEATCLRPVACRLPFLPFPFWLGGSACCSGYGGKEKGGASNAALWRRNCMAWLPGSNSSNLLLMRQKCFSPPLALPTDLSPPPLTPFSLHSFPPSHLTAVKGALGAIMWRRREEGRGGTPDSCSESLPLLFPFPNRKWGMCERGDRMFLHVRVRRRETNCCGQE